jgi:hypothetical protein
MQLTRSDVWQFLLRWIGRDAFSRDCDPKVVAAIEWRKTAAFRHGVNYAWAVKLAKDLHDYYEKSAKEIDDKAASVVGYLGGGTGLFTLGSVAAVGSGNAHWSVVVAALPSFLAAGLALHLAACVRRTHEFSIPSASSAVAYANFDEFIPPHTEGKTGNGEVEFMGQWHEAAAKVGAIVERKGALFDRSLRVFVIAVFSLILPLFTGIVVSIMKPTPVKPAVTLVVER